MDGFGELFKGIGEALTGALEGREVLGGASEALGGEERVVTETYERVLTGGRRTPNVNDL